MSKVAACTDIPRNLTAIFGLSLQVLFQQKQQAGNNISIDNNTLENLTGAWHACC
jgi:hypothetical protein